MSKKKNADSLVAQRVTAVEEYLIGIGSELSPVQLHEVVARALGFKNKHLLAAMMGGKGADRSENPAASATTGTFQVGGKTYPVLPVGHLPYSFEEIKNSGFKVAAIVPVPADIFDLSDEIEETLDFVSAALTGSPTILSDVCCRHVPGVDCGEGFVGVLVCAEVEDPDEFHAKTKAFYGDLNDFLVHLGDGSECAVADVIADAIFSDADSLTGATVARVNQAALSALREYVQSHGARRERYQRMRDRVVCWMQLAGDEAPLPLTVGAIGSATRVDQTAWEVYADEVPYSLAFSKDVAATRAKSVQRP